MSSAMECYCEVQIVKDKNGVWISPDTGSNLCYASDTGAGGWLEHEPMGVWHDDIDNNMGEQSGSVHRHW